MRLGEDKSGFSYGKMVKDIPIVSDVYFSREYQHRVIDFVTPIVSEYDEMFPGLLVVTMHKSELDKITIGKTVVDYKYTKRGDVQEVIRKGRTREVYLVNHEKRMITPSRFLDGTFLKQSVDTTAVTYSLTTRNTL
jgi:DNA-directed RNA polymerase subunit H (RpoH/RPB5)